MIVLLGTGHVFDLEAAVQAEIRERGPGVVALELDPDRYRALQSGEREPQGSLFYRALARFQQGMAERYGVQPGDEMLAASRAAREIGAPVALVDRDAQSMFTRLWSEMGWWERIRFVGSSVGGLLLPGDKVEDQLEEIQEDAAAYMAALGERYPTVKRVLLDERNHHMADRIDDLGRRHEVVVAVLGDGHVDGIRDILEGRGHEVETVRLRELRDREPRASSAGFTVEVGAGTASEEEGLDAE
jgi:pheromone shutdown protein TraB